MTSSVDPPARPDPYVVARFLDRLLEDDREHTRSTLQAAVGLNYDSFRSYLALLEGKGWVAWDPREGRGKDVIRLTPAGREAHDQLVGWIRDALGHGLVDRRRR